MKKPLTLRSLGEQYRTQAEALGEQIARRRKNFESRQFTMTAKQREQYYVEMEVLRKQRQDALVVARTLMSYYDENGPHPCNGDAPLTFRLDITPRTVTEAAG